MNRTMAWIGIVAAGVTASWLGCSSSGSTGTATTHGTGGTAATSSTGTKAGTGGTKASTSSVTTGTNAGGAGGAGFGGAGGGNAGTGIQCNPVTNAPCSSTEQCDTNFDGAGDIIGFVCWPSNNVALCAMCDPGNNLACAPGGTCFIYDNNGDSACTQYCCTDADCGTGKCQTGFMGMPYFAPLAQNLGICVAASSAGTGGSGTGGSGTGGGAVDAGTLPDGSAPDPYQCTVPSTPPSGGSCVTLSM